VDNQNIISNKIINALDKKCEIVNKTNEKKVHVLHMPGMALAFV
jgi:hypothetical protein